MVWEPACHERDAAGRTDSKRIVSVELHPLGNQSIRCGCTDVLLVMPADIPPTLSGRVSTDRWMGQDASVQMHQSGTSTGCANKFPGHVFTARMHHIDIHVHAHSLTSDTQTPTHTHTHTHTHSITLSHTHTHSHTHTLTPSGAHTHVHIRT